MSSKIRTSSNVKKTKLNKVNLKSILVKLGIKLESILTLVGIKIVKTYHQKHNIIQVKNYVFPTKNLKRYKFPTHINDLVMDRSEASFSEVFIVIIGPGNAPPLHKHNDTEQIFYITEGKGLLTIGNDSPKFMQVSTGDVVRIPVGAWHSIKADGTDELKYLAIDCFSNIRNQDEPNWDSHVKVLCEEQGWNYESVI